MTNSSNRTKVRMTFLGANLIAARLTGLLAIFYVVRAFRRGWLLDLVLALLAFNFLFALVLREALAVVVSQKGLSFGWSRRILLWSEVEEVSLGKIGSISGLRLRLRSGGTKLIANGVAHDPSFRDAMQRLGPSDHPLRSTLDHSGPAAAVSKT